MPYNSLLDRSDSGPLIPEEVEREIFQHVPETSAVMRLSRRLRDMARQERTLRVLDGLATAYFVGHSTAASGDNARIQTSEITWANKYIRAAKLGVIVPVPIDVAEDVDYDLWGEIRPQLTEAFGRTFDAAVFYGTGAPSDWPADLVTRATAAGNVVSLSNLPEGSVDFYDAEGCILCKCDDAKTGWFIVSGKTLSDVQLIQEKPIQQPLRSSGA